MSVNISNEYHLREKVHKLLASIALVMFVRFPWLFCKHNRTWYSVEYENERKETFSNSMENRILLEEREEEEGKPITK